MNKFKLILFGFFLSHLVAFANYNDIYIADIDYDWINKSMSKKEAIVKEIQDIVFENGTIETKKILKKDLKGLVKDKDYKRHYYAASAARKEIDGFYIKGFYYKKQKHIYMYSLQNKDDIFKILYYDALGNLKYFDWFYGGYPENPHYTVRYKIDGTPVNVTYYITEDTQYVFKPDSTFVGLWYKHNLYNINSDIIEKRIDY